MAYRVGLNEEVARAVNAFDGELRRAWDLRLNTLIDDPLPHEGAGFSIVTTKNRHWNDTFLTLVADEFAFVIQYDVVPWPQSEDNPLEFQGKVAIFRLVAR